MRVVIDSNIFVMCMNNSSSYHVIFKKLVQGNYMLCVTTEIIFEYTEVFQRKFNSVKAEMLTDFLNESPYVKNTDVFFKWDLIEEDNDDNKYVDCYIASYADFLVTNDKHFKILTEGVYPKVNCVNIDDFLNILDR